MQYPKKIQIGFQEGTCPLKCKKCLAFGEHAEAKKIPQKMPLEKAKRLIDEISKMEVIPAIQPNIYTEPFANEDLKEIIPYCCSKKIPINIITNGILLNNEWMDLLIRWLDRSSTISFSLDAFTQETYEKVRGHYDLGELEQKIEYLMNNRGDSGPRVTVSFTYEEDNYNEKDDFLRRWSGKVDAVRINVVLDSQRKIPIIYKKGDVIKKGSECPFMRESLTIDAGGEVRACPIDAFGMTYLGNVFEEEIMSIWNGEQMELLRQKQRQGRLQEEDYCFGCEWGYSVYDFNRTEETEDYIMKISDYAVYYNYKEKK